MAMYKENIQTPKISAQNKEYWTFAFRTCTALGPVSRQDQLADTPCLPGLVFTNIPILRIYLF